MAVLREVEGDREFPLRRKVTILGRDPGCDIAVPRSQVSAQHALIVHLGDAYYVEDLGSLNGTSVNGAPVRQRTRLAPGDRLEIPGLAVTFQETSARPAATETVKLIETPTTEPLGTIISSLDLAGEARLAVAPEAKLRAVLEISRALGNTLDLDAVLPRILETLFTLFPQADRGFIVLRDPATGQLVPKAIRHRREPPPGPVALSRTVLDHALATGRAVLTADAGSDERFDSSMSIRRLRLRSIMCVPLPSQAGAPLGALQIDTQDTRGTFRQEDLDVLLCCCGEAARAVELARLHEERRDLEAATRIQKSFLPAERPKIPGLRFFDCYLPAQHVGGDYYDYIALPGERLAVALGDVAGKGVSAALLMARLSAEARFCLATAPTVPDAVRQLNKALARGFGDDRFVTFVVFVLDLRRFTMTLVNAGHLPPLRRQAGQPAVESVGEEIVGLPLAGIDRPYEQAVVPLERGDTLLLCTDGVTEARNPAGELYGVERLRAAMQAAPDGVESVGQAVLADVRRFAAGRPLGDDVTVVCFGRER